MSELTELVIDGSNKMAEGKQQLLSVFMREKHLFPITLLHCNIDRDFLVVFINNEHFRILI